MLKLYLRLGIPMLLVSALAAAGLAATYAVTKGPIEEQNRLAQERALQAVLPDAKAFEEVGDKAKLDAADKAAGDTDVLSIFAASDGAGDPVGWGITVLPRGYGGPMRIVVGVDRNGKVTGVNVVSHNETPGLGTKAVGALGGKPAEYLSIFLGVDSAESAGDLDTIMGATKSSRGVRHGVEAALLAYEAVLAEGGGTP